MLVALVALSVHDRSISPVEAALVARLVMGCHSPKFKLILLGAAVVRVTEAAAVVGVDCCQRGTAVTAMD